MKRTLGFIVSLLFFFGLPMAAAQALETPASQIHVSVMNEQWTDGTFHTYYSFYPYAFAGVLPDDITSVTVKTPGDTVHSLSWDPFWHEFAAYIDGSPEPGVHDFTVTTTTGEMKAADYQYVLLSIPIPDASRYLPVEGTVVSSTTPVFRWEPVDLPGVPLFYRFEVRDSSTGERVWASSRTMGMTSVTLKNGMLAPGSYRWRVTVSDSADWVDTQNTASGAWVNFTVPADLIPHDALPAIHPDNFNGLTWNGGGFAASVKVIDQDGVAFDGSSHTVKVTPPAGAAFPDGSPVKYADFDSSSGPTAGYYWLYVGGGTPVSGEYTFTVTDLDGNAASFVEQVDVDVLPAADEASLTPGNMGEAIAATFDNVLVNGMLYETFNLADINQLDPGKWKWISGAAIVGNELAVDLHDAVGRAHGGINFNDTRSITAVQADVTITAMTASWVGDKGAGIAGTFFNDGSNADFWVSLRHNGQKVRYELSRQWINQQGTYQWEDILGQDLVAATVGDVVRMGVTWDPAFRTLTFSAFNMTQAIGPVIRTYVHPGPVYPPISKELGLQARINLTMGTTPTFGWDPVPGALRYRLRIYTHDSSRTIWSGYTGSETSITVPPGVLEPNASYRYRLDAFDKPSPLSVDNYSRTPSNSSDNYRFYTGSQIPEQPAIGLDGRGVQAVQSDETGVFPAFWVRVCDPQGVPGNIASVKVAWPGCQTQAFLYLDHTQGPFDGYYAAVSNQPAEPGTYTFTVTDRDGHTATITDELVYDPIGYPASGSLTAIVGPEDILVNWDPVSGAAFYELEIYNEAYESFLSLAVDAAEGHSISVPRGLLKEGRLYRYQVRTCREFFSEITGIDSQGNIDNASQTPWSPTQYPFFFLSPAAGASGPAIDLDNRGVFVSHSRDPFTGQDVFLLEFQVRVTDVDGIPGNIDRVYATLPTAQTLNLTYDERISDTEAYYSAYMRFADLTGIAALEGNFTFTVTDMDGRSATSGSDNLSDTGSNMPAIPSYLSPRPDTMLYTTTPNISWAPVAGADSYRVRLFTSRHRTLSWSDPILAPTTYWKVPYGLLEPGTTYAFRVYATRGLFPLEDLDFRSFNLVYPSLLPHFSISMTPDSDADGILDAVEEGHACLDPQDADADNDYLIDGIEDTDRDGFRDAGETDPCDWDTDNDRMSDGYEVNYGLDPLVDDAFNDQDGDGFSNIREFAAWTQPRNWWDAPVFSAEIEDFETGDLNRFPWLTSGSEPWSVTDSHSYNSVYAAQAGVVNDNEMTSLSISRYTEAGDISFWLAVDSEPDHGWLNFYIDERLAGQWSGSVVYTQAIFPLTNGMHHFCWEYAKTNAIAQGVDTAWIDTIVFPGSVDSDGDGMPDGWEIDHYLDPWIDDTGGDEDNDRFTNGLECLMGTDPRNGLSLPPMIKGFDDDLDVDGLDLLRFVEALIGGGVPFTEIGPFAQVFGWAQ